MRLYEFAGPDPLLVNLVAVMSNLKNNIDTRHERSNWTVDELLDYLRQQEINLDREDLLDMVTNPPMNKFIANIQGDDVIFKNQETGEREDDPDKRKELVKKMAHRAMSK